MGREQAEFRRVLEVSMEHVENHNAFNILFILSFFASIALVVIQFG